MSMDAERTSSGLEVIRFEVVSFDDQGLATMGTAFNQRYVNALFDTLNGGNDNYAKLVAAAQKITGIKGVIPNVLNVSAVVEDIDVVLNADELDGPIGCVVDLIDQYVGALPSGVRFLAGELSYGAEQDTLKARSILLNSGASYGAILAGAIEKDHYAKEYRNLGIFAINTMVSDEVRAAVAIAPALRSDVLSEQLQSIADSLFPEETSSEPF